MWKLCLALLVCVACAVEPSRPELIGYAQLPADSFADGPPSGAFREPSSSSLQTFPGQPIQGVSGLARGPQGSFFALVDNGFGSKANSPDFLLRIYCLDLDFKTEAGGSGTVGVGPKFISLSDPDRKMDFPLVNDNSTQRLLTGADLDPESIVLLDDGSFWVGDEFGPFLLHFDAQGKLLRAPIELPDFEQPGVLLTSADHPNVATATKHVAIARSKGIESLALSESKQSLIVMLEAGLHSDPPGLVRLLEFELATQTFSPRQWRYQLSSASHAVRDMARLHNGRHAVIEGDSGHGAQARFKKVFLLDSLERSAGLIGKTELIDLLSVADRNNLSAYGPDFSLPYVTIEGLLAVSEDVLLVANDNNFPSAGARDNVQPDPNEFALIRVAIPSQ